MLCLESDSSKILSNERKSTEIEIDVWSLMHHSCNQANVRLLTSPITDRNSLSSPDFLCLKRRKGAKRALENLHGLGSQSLPTTGVAIATYNLNGTWLSYRPGQTEA